MQHPSFAKTDDLGFTPFPSPNPKSWEAGSKKPDSLLIGPPRLHIKDPRVSQEYTKGFSSEERVNILTGVPSGGVIGNSSGLRSNDSKQFDTMDLTSDVMEQSRDSQTKSRFGEEFGREARSSLFREAETIRKSNVDLRFEEIPADTVTGDSTSFSLDGFNKDY